MNKSILAGIFLVLVLAGCDSAEEGTSTAVADQAPTRADGGGDGRGAGDGAGSGDGGKPPPVQDAGNDGEPRGKFAEGTEREWGGFERGKCGTKVYLVTPTGERVDFERPANLAEPLLSTSIVTAENNERQGFAPVDVFNTYGGNRMKVFSCDEGRMAEVRIDESDRFLFVLNGRKVVKLMESHAPEPATTPVKMLEHIELFTDNEESAE